MYAEISKGLGFTLLMSCEWHARDWMISSSSSLRSEESLIGDGLCNVECVYLEYILRNDYQGMRTSRTFWEMSVLEDHTIFQLL